MGSLDERETEQRLFLPCLNVIPEACLVLSQDFQVIQANSSALRMFGTKAEKGELLTGAIRVAIPDADTSHEKILQLVRNTKPYLEGEVILDATRTQSVRLFNIGENIGLMAGKPAACKQAEEIQTRTVSNVLNAMGVGLIEMTPEGVIMYVNPAFEKITGHSRSEVVGLSYEGLIPKILEPVDAQRYQELTKKLFDGGSVNQIALVISSKDGRRVHVAGTGSAILDSDMKPLLIILTFMDITEHMEAMGLLREMVEKLKSSNADLEQFAYIASHDLQEPLRMITRYLQLLSRRYSGQLDADADDFINFAVDGAARMSKLITDLLAYSRVERLGGAIEPTDCEDVLRQVLGNLQLKIDENQAVITHDSLPVIPADRTQLVQLFQNLLENAIKFRGKQPPVIHVGAKKEGDMWLFTFKDNGVGIDPQFHSKLFKIFQRFHGREVPGTGIGLAIAKRIVERHNGKIWVESQPNEGSLFCFLLPSNLQGETYGSKEKGD